MRILIVSLFLPEEKASHAGGRFVFEMIRVLSHRHDVCLATRLEEDKRSSLEALRPFCREIYPYTYRSSTRRTLKYVISLAWNYFGFSHFADRLLRKSSFDLVMVEWVEAALLIRKRGVPMILDAHDVITKPAERGMRQSRGLAWCTAFIKYKMIKALERRIARRFDVVLTRSSFDQKVLLSIEPDLRVEVVPHPAGLDITDRAFERERNDILFLASYKYRRVNVDAALYFYREVFPLVRESIPDARFIAAGYGPPAELTSLAANDRGFIVPGFVEDLDECYKKAAVFVAPILVGGGIIVKILDAMAAGTPVVTTSIGNEGIGAVQGRDLLVADNAVEFADGVVRLLRDRGFAEKIAKNAKNFVTDNYSPEAVMARLEGAFNELLREGS